MKTELYNLLADYVDSQNDLALKYDNLLSAIERKYNLTHNS